MFVRLERATFNLFSPYVVRRGDWVIILNKVCRQTMGNVITSDSPTVLSRTFWQQTSCTWLQRSQYAFCYTLIQKSPRSDGCKTNGSDVPTQGPLWPLDVHESVSSLFAWRWTDQSPELFAMSNYDCEDRTGCFERIRHIVKQSSVTVNEREWKCWAGHSVTGESSTSTNIQGFSGALCHLVVSETCIHVPRI